MKNKDKVTIRDVAKLSGVSIATVSRVLNNSESVKPDKVTRVRLAIEQLNYNPDPAARALGNRQGRTIAVVVPNINNPVLSNLVKGIIHSLDNSDFDVMLFDTEESFEREKRLISSILSKFINGLIVIAGAGEEIGFSEVVEQIPVVLIDRPMNLSHVDKLNVDEKEGMLNLVNHLIGQGYKNIGFINGVEKSVSAASRLDAFMHAVDETGISFESKNIIHAGWNMEDGRDGFDILLQRAPGLDAVIGSTDSIGLGALMGAAKLGISIPSDLAVTGFDNSYFGEVTYPSLTTLGFPGYEMGQQAVSTILRRLENPDAALTKITYSLPLIARQSTGFIPL